MTAFFELFGGLPRQGPGSDSSTRRALQARPRQPGAPRILDLGCGPGRQSLVLAQETGGTVVAVDLHEPFLREVQELARRTGVAGRVETRCVSMEAIDDPPESYDIVWSEGALYLVGLERGLELAHKLLKPGGLLAFTEATWLTSDRPPEARAFWADAYPDIATLDANRAKAKRAGFRVRDAFPLPPDDWWTEYYTPLRKRIEALREQARMWPELAAVIKQTEHEIEVFERFGESYGYVFYLLQKPPA